MKNISASILTALRIVPGLTGLALLSACTGLSTPHSDQAEAAATVKEAAQAALSAEKALNKNDSADAENQDALPAVRLTEELFYKILTAEIAYQRGNWQAAYVTLLGVAQQTRDYRLARRAAEIALSNKQAGEALSAIRLWRELAPNSNEATQYYLGFMLMQNNLSEIQNVFSEKLRLAPPPQHAVIMLQLQRLLSRAHDKNAAFDTLETLLAPYKDSSDAHLALAQGAYVKGDHQRAIKEAQAVLAGKPDSQLAILTVAQASRQEDAAAALQDFLGRNPSARDVRLAYASILLDLKQFEQAGQEFERLLRDKPDDVSAIYTLGVLAMKKGHAQQAEDYFRRYLQIQEGKPANEERDPTAALINLAQIAIERKDYRVAQEWLTRVESYEGRNPAWFNVQMRRASLMAKAGQLEAARHFLAGIKTANEAEITQRIQTEAQILKDAQQAAAARLVLQNGLQLQPDNTELLYDLAMLAEARQDVAEMETALRRIIALKPDNPHAYNALGYSLADRNLRLEEALALIEKALQFAPDDPFILDSLGWAKYRLGKLDEAEQRLRRAYQLRPDAEIAVHLGEVLWIAGQKDQAQRFWRDAAGRDPDSETLRATLQRLQVKP